MNTLNTENTDSLKQAKQVLKDNDQGAYSLPTHGLYPVQFNWDSAFAALGYSTYAPERAWDELFLLASSQWPDGMIPHIMFRGDHEGYFPGPSVWKTGQYIPTSGITQPPVLASVVHYLFEYCSTGKTQSLHDLLRRLLRWHDWFMQARREPETGAILVIHPWESGRDNLTDWDQAMQRVPLADLPPYQRRDLDHVDASQRPSKDEYDRYLSLVQFGVDHYWDQAYLGQHSPFRMVDPGMTAFLLRANRDLLALLKAHNFAEADCARIATYIQQLEQGWRNLWNPAVKAYTAYDPVLKQAVNSVSAASFLHAYAGIQDDIEHGHTMDHFKRITQKVRYMVPSFDPDHELFDAKRYWRGPVWSVVNSSIAKGLGELGEIDAAERIRSDTRELNETQGFYEYFDPLTGKGLGGGHFTWTAAMYLSWAQPRGMALSVDQLKGE